MQESAKPVLQGSIPTELQHVPPVETRIAQSALHHRPVQPAKPTSLIPMATASPAGLESGPMAHRAPFAPNAWITALYAVQIMSVALVQQGWVIPGTNARPAVMVPTS
jgi:hypothetical protein